MLGKDHLFADTLCFFQGEPHLAMVFIRRREPLFENEPQQHRTGDTYTQNQYDEASTHDSPWSQLSTGEKPRTSLDHTPRDGLPA
ncbi:MAG: hypothetical protein AUH13_20375 [Acidobacteria bacterium 13_2_20CM_58_27]|nr:MAG: hypothetical protein AUH13_20375 [Acidobacteria bacterium 13_2_20CM_58_27]